VVIRQIKGGIQVEAKPEMAAGGNAKEEVLKAGQVPIAALLISVT
jgi:hypothetical protein